MGMVCHADSSLKSDRNPHASRAFILSALQPAQEPHKVWERDPRKAVVGLLGCGFL